MFVKFCGMTRRQDIEYAIDRGVDAIGLIFANSPRQVSVEQARRLVDGLDILKVGVFVNEEIETIQSVRSQCGLDVVQLHGDETPEYCRQLGGEIFKAFRIRDESTLQKIVDYAPKIKVLLDAYVMGLAGGTGRRIDYLLLDRIDDFSRIIIAGGVGPENIADIVHRYHPYGVDVNSKVETAPGVKDHEKMRLFFERLKEQ